MTSACERTGLNVGNATPIFLCPVTGGWLFDAQLLSCERGDIVSRIGSEKLFGDMKKGGCKIKAPCPVCNEQVVSYSPLSLVKSLFDTVFEKTSTKEPLTAADTANRDEVQVETPSDEYPLKHVNFNTSSGNWNSSLGDGVTEKSLYFINQVLDPNDPFPEKTKPEIFYNFYLRICKSNDSFRFIIGCGYDKNEGYINPFMIYLEKLGFYNTITNYHDNVTIIKTNKYESLLFLKILLKNNTFSPECLDLLNQVAMEIANDCTSFPADSLHSKILCPVTGELLENARVLSCPNSHVVSLTGAKKLFEGVENSTYEIKVTCPVCSEPVDSYCHIPRVLKPVDEALENTSTSKAIESVFTDFRNKLIMQKQRNKYPFESILFYVAEDTWNSSNPVKTLIFESEVGISVWPPARKTKPKNYPIKTIFIFKEKDCFCFDILFTRNSDDSYRKGFKKYLEMHGFNDLNDNTVYCQILIGDSNKDQSMLFLNIMLENNTFTPEYTALLNQIVNELEALP
jgi:hypothetical protein